MTDVLTPEQRSRCMSAIRAKGTKPELVVRKILTQLGYRYRLHNTSLPGKPDIVIHRIRQVISVNGCFWHGHKCKYGKVSPKTNAKFWKEKIEGNVRRDRINQRKLRKSGWSVLNIWECKLKEKQIESTIIRIDHHLKKQTRRFSDTLKRSMSLAVRLVVESDAD